MKTTNTMTKRVPVGMSRYASALGGGLVSSRITMKICFFHLMPYRFLPEDFERKYRSVWVDVPHHLHEAFVLPPDQVCCGYHDPVEMDRPPARATPPEVVELTGVR